MKLLVTLSALCLLIAAQARAQMQSASTDELSVSSGISSVTQSTDSNLNEDTNLLRPGPGPGHGGPGIHPGGPGHGGPGIHPGGPGHGGPGWHGGHGWGGGHAGWHGGGPRPGWRNGWRWDFGRHPFWWRVGIEFPLFIWAIDTPQFWWQCTAFDEEMPYSAAAPTRDEAAYNALYDCGGPNYANQCYIPPGYCQLRN